MVMTKKPKILAPRGKNLRSQLWFDNPDNPGMTAIYLERYLNYGLTGPELRSGKPIVGIAQTGSDLSPCNRHHLELAKRVRDGIRDAGGIAFEFPCHPIQETGKRPTAALDRNLAYLSLVEVLYGYPLDGVVLLTGCDKTTPALIMAAATMNIPAIVLSGGPMLNGWWKGVRAGSGTAMTARLRPRTSRRAGSSRSRVGRSVNAIGPSHATHKPCLCGSESAKRRLRTARTMRVTAGARGSSG